jgi:hypothetical protein
MANEHVWLDAKQQNTELRCEERNGYVCIDIIDESNGLGHSIDLTAEDIEVLIAHLSAQKAKIPF